MHTLWLNDIKGKEGHSELELMPTSGALFCGYAGKALAARMKFMGPANAVTMPGSALRAALLLLSLQVVCLPSGHGGGPVLCATQ
jgi:hypothetical protein